MKRKTSRQQPRAMDGARPPRFRSVEEESAFWDRHDPLEYGTWKEISYERFLKECGRLSSRKVHMTIRVERELIDRLKSIARKHRIKYQILARQLLWRHVRSMAQ
jgi:predicted DNA binding CopG/RHH family protein